MDTLSFTISENSILNVCENHLIVSESSVISSYWDCEFTEGGTLECSCILTGIDTFSLYVRISPSGYMRIYADDLTVPKINDWFLSKLQHLFHPFGKMKLTLWKSHIIPKGADALEGTLSLSYNEEDAKVSINFTYFKQKCHLNFQKNAYMKNANIFHTSVNIDLRRFGV